MPLRYRAFTITQVYCSATCRTSALRGPTASVQPEKGFPRWRPAITVHPLQATGGT